MKSIYISLLLFLFSQLSYGQIYVNVNATGSNDGTSWNNAYLSIQDALNDTSPNDIWIASGTYYPSEQALGSYFNMWTQHNMYGGFEGSETSLDDRDLVNNEVIINGDFNNDDDLTNFNLNRTDNAIHLLVIEQGLEPVTIDGIHFWGGATSLDSDLEDFYTRGGAVLSFGSININNCHFENNVSISGAAIYTAFTSNNSISNCNFFRNRGVSQSAGILLNECTNSTITSCKFQENLATRGCLYTLYCKDITVSDCIFHLNESPEGDWGCAGYFNWNSENITMEGCDFTRHTAGSASAVYIDGRDTSYHNISFKECVFEDNACTNYGGAVYCWQCDYDMDDCTFTDNIGPNAAALYNGGATFEIMNSTFQDCAANFGGAISNYTSSDGTYENCIFSNNEANTSGAACMVGFLSDIRFTNCEFTGNTAQYGGSVYIQNDTSSAHFNTCVFLENRAVISGGAINSSGDNAISFSSCDFSINLADFGAAITSTGGPLQTFKLEIDKCIFNTNYADTQGGGLNLNNQDAIVRSSLFINNAAQADGNGGAIANNAFAGGFSSLQVINSTLADNEGLLAGGIMQFQDDTSQAALFLTNCILHQKTFPDYAVEEGTPSFTSLGGNSAYDVNLSTYLNNTNDDLGSDPLFVSNTNYQLTEGSPAIDTGVEDGAHTTDLKGKPIVGIPDKGANEYNTSVGTSNLVIENDLLQIVQNPVDQQLDFYVEGINAGQLTVRIFNIEAKRIDIQQISAQENQRYSIHTGKLTKGQYLLSISSENVLLTKAFTKM